MEDQKPAPQRDTLRIRHHNDRFRRSLTGGQVVMTPGIAALPAETMADILKAVVKFNCFDLSNDPWGERDFGQIVVGSHAIFWKIDYYDLDMKHGSPDPAKPEVTTRVLTIMLAGEY